MTPQLSSLALRVISSLILIPVVIGVVFLGGWIYAILVTALLGVAFYEWINLSKYIPGNAGMKMGLSAIGLFYLGFSAFEIMTLRAHPDGVFWTIIFCMAVWASDSGAYLFGKTIGGPKMTPTVSPNKTWAGYVGALISPTLILFIATQIIPPDSLIDRVITPSGIMACLAGISVGIAGQSGDLMISFMKRKAGLKDTGNIIPGHGGILDRIDALLLALPVFMAYLKYITIPE